jgi:PAS domain S-box-containing protein
LRAIVVRGRGDSGSWARSARRPLRAGPLGPDVFERFFETSLSLFAIVDREGRVMRANPSWERVLGYRPEELVGRRLVELIHRDDRERTIPRAAAVRQGDAVADGFENRYLHRDGSVRLLRWTSTFVERLRRGEGPMRYVYRAVRPDGAVRHIDSISDWELGDDGRPLRLLGICQDITERVEPSSASSRPARWSVPRFATTRSPCAWSTSTRVVLDDDDGDRGFGVH